MNGLILYNGNIHTLDEKRPKAEAIAIEGNKIVAIDQQIKNLEQKYLKKINLKQKTVLPGFIDSHTHFISFAKSLNLLDLDEGTSLDETLKKLRAFAKRKNKEEWIFAKRWNINLWKKLVLPDKKILDKISASNPIVVFSKDGHSLWVNSKVLEIAKIDESTADPSGGRIERYSNSHEPSGILKERACDFVYKIIKEPEEQILSQLLKEAFKRARQKGIVGIHDCEDEKALELFESFQKKQELSLRVFMMIPQKNLDEAIRIGYKTGLGNEYLRIGGVKIFADGALGSRTALMFKPYNSEPKNSGVEVNSQKDLLESVKKASQNHLSVAIHAIGDKANHQALNAIEKGNHNKNLRHRIEHAQVLDPRDIRRFAQLDIIASMQPIHCPSDRVMAEKYWGKRSQQAYVFKTLLDSGTRLAFGSDLPLYGFDPLKGIYAAVTRKGENGGNSWNSKEKISVAQAVYAYTKGAAYASYEENLKGSLEIGKLADMAVLSKDIFKIAPDEILKTEVLATLWDGKIVYNDDFLEISD
ncbi:MAG: Amidohydrolase 3 [candidate division Zixibacteria bacterium RBG-1]|nr:MAG: Amidohydrolase 3 [candidate division Zixibacteria bacterium RBG-1]OGC85362.1 MAG: hypothetical protein A2V73_09110 [candidate division Zixibacteria bacterium RBG_19FT_COMBO_42_43]